MTFVADMLDRIKFRPAKKEDSRTISHLFSIFSDGISDYTWKTLADPGEEVLDVGERRYSRDNTPFSYQNCTVAEIGGEIVGMIAAFPMETLESNDGEMDVDPVLAPYSKLEQPNSYWIGGMAVFPEYRRKGYGSKFLEIAEQQAKDLGLSLLSLIVFEQNEGAKRLYDRHVYYEIGREKVVPHELIHVTGYALLMVKDI
ncbi:GNAT family N-acetyltransferase [Desulfobacterota bacterium AH_259_B03_O07]|nr:GNAT family N-acetyltransferase [Desulfobacterota bacterium AH_259_B03_O07]